ncbi:hypothetical protein TrST_g1844 [Triparma strigata]|uniref:Uncharacterized protein n=1 Tax=Triparma strigata TaxID=1606541 RepID=A0A9W7BIH4_9STRA|nr:hypothetical protein TrST_g1844 [Triparma strigata]
MLIFWTAGIHITSSHPCDSEHAANCPAAAGERLGECLEALSDNSSSQACKEWLHVQSVCSSELLDQCDKRNEGSPCKYNDDAIPCLAFWTHPDYRVGYSVACKELLPKGEKEEISEETKSERRRRKEERKRKRREKMEKEQEGNPLNLPDPGEL